MNKKGFTLMELMLSLMIVLAILGILSCIFIPKYVRFSEKQTVTITTNVPESSTIPRNK